jgi:putative polyketide hydroxylase
LLRRGGAGARTMASMHHATDIEDIPVLVAGAGPGGLAAAIELARRDVPVMLAERRTILSSHPRATVLSLRSMELMRAWGLEERVREHSADVDSSMLLAATMAEAAAGSSLPVGYPSREQSRVLSPVEPACIAQDDVEPLLLAHLRAHSVARVELGTEVTGVRTGDDGALATLRDVTTGEERTVHARLLVAADGARSAVRAALGIALRGEDDVLTGFSTLFRAPLWDVVGEHRHLIYSMTRPEAPASFIPAGRSDRWLFGLRSEGPNAPGDRRAAELIRRGAGVPGLPLRIEGSRGFSSGAQLAEQFRSGPVFLAGDAAHRVTPRGGTGLNIALHDGYDLGWKLAWVLRDWARPALLDTYEAERRPVAEYTVARSADPNGSIRAPEQEVHADLGGRIPHVWAGERSTLDLLGAGLTLLAGRDGTDWEAAGSSLTARVPVDVRRLDAVAARAVGAGRSALLVRPDGQPAAVLPPAVEPALALRAAVASVTAGRRVP